MTPFELRDAIRKQPFQPFRLVMTDGKGFDILHPDLIWVGMTAAYVGLTGDLGRALFERSVYVDLNHVIRLEPLPVVSSAASNGQGS